MKGKRVVSLLLIVLLLLLAAAAGAWWWRADRGAVSFRTASIERGPIEAAVAASGTLRPVVQVQVGSQVSGQIAELGADFNSEVKAGQLIARIDPATFEYRLRQAEADLEAARAGLLSARANLMSAQAQATRAQVELDNARADLARKEGLRAREFISQVEVDNARLALRAQEQVLASAQAQVGVVQAQVATAQAAIRQREAQRAQAQVDLQRTEIRSPLDGVVISRSVQLGQTVAASLQAPELFVIAQNLRDMQVEVAIDEADVGRVREGLASSFTVDAFVNRRFEGTVRQVRKAAVTTSNVVTYTVVVGFDNVEGRLLPGMTANVRIVTDRRESALKVPNAALRVRMPAHLLPPSAPGAGPVPPDRPGAATGNGAPVAAGAAGTRPPGARPPGMRPPGAVAPARAVIYLLDERGKPLAVPVRVGISDGSMTEVMGPAELLAPGRAVVTGVTDPSAATRASGGPRLGF